MKCEKCEDKSVDLIDLDEHFYWHPSCDKYTRKENNNDKKPSEDSKIYPDLFFSICEFHTSMGLI